MRIRVNSKNEVISYSEIGGMNYSIKVEFYPDNFIELYKPRYFIYIDNQIKPNPNYTPTEEVEAKNPVEELRLDISKEIENESLKVQYGIAELGNDVEANQIGVQLALGELGHTTENDVLETQLAVAETTKSTEKALLDIHLALVEIASLLGGKE